jgi:hypothetical protein
LIENSQKCPSTSTFQAHFGSVLVAFERLGYRQLRYRQTYAAWRKSISDAVIAQVHACGGNVVRERFCDQSRFIANDELRVAVIVVRLNYKTIKGETRWILKQRANCRADLMIVARLDAAATKIHDYLIFPRTVLDCFRRVLTEVNHVQIDAFRSDSLSPLTRLFTRRLLHSNFARSWRASDEATALSADFQKTTKIKYTRNAQRNAAAKVLFRAYQLKSQRMISLIDKFNLATVSQMKLDHTLRSLISDNSFRELLFDEGLDDLPAIFAKRLN